ncbi:unnamed protein product [Polarella glacialis]|uniref:Tyrosine specific protein phosphatases domain-containing protein n=1 Tax=Polarella glacialis TaxID=89957 RepID=A0A813JAW5_POLGL|nr:unnamed protein product [Polarella glacialis]
MNCTDKPVEFQSLLTDELASALRNYRQWHCRPDEGKKATVLDCGSARAIFESGPIRGRAHICTLTTTAAGAVMRDFRDSGAALRARLQSLSSDQLWSLVQQVQAEGQVEARLLGFPGAFLRSEHLQVDWKPAKLGWVAIGRGMLTAPGAPSGKSVRTWVQEGASCVVSLLRSTEPQFDSARRACEAAGLRWEHCPLSGKLAVTLPAKCKSYDDSVSLERLQRLLPELLEAQERVVLHCAAGMHRTGAAVFGALRDSGLTAELALAGVADMRPVTHAALLAVEKAYAPMPLWAVIEAATWTTPR